MQLTRSKNLYVNLKKRRLRRFVNPISYIFDRQQIKIDDRYEEVPRIIYTYWDQGLENSPDLIKICTQSWKIHNPGWEFKLLDRNQANEVVSRDNLPHDVSEASYSDILRITLLKKTGGVWVDATALCTKPLDTWLSVVTANGNAFFFHRPWRDRIVSSWFIAANANNTLIRNISDGVDQFWRARKKQPNIYFWLHYLIEATIICNIQSWREYRRMPKVSATTPHKLSLLLQKKIPDTDHSWKKIKSFPIQKLSYKEGYNANDLSEAIRRIGLDQHHEF